MTKSILFTVLILNVEYTFFYISFRMIISILCEVDIEHKFILRK